MENAMVSFLTPYPYTSNVIPGFNEALTDTSSQINSNLIVYDDSFCLYGNFCNDDDQFDVQRTEYTQSSSIVFSGSASITPRQNLEESFQEETHLNFMPVQEDLPYQPWNNIPHQQSNNGLQLIPNARKRSAEASHAMQDMMSSSIHGLIDSTNKERTRDKKRPTPFQEKRQKIQKEKVPIVKRRSQKLTDRITALQKLVSPYGKTDTASVLLEASISIKELHDQIKELFHTISGQQMTKMIGEKGSDLQSRGLCLAPCGILKELDRRNLTHHCLLQ